MEKEHIREQLPISKILHHYGVQPGRNSGSYFCPFHEDKTPSLVAKDERGVATCMAGCFGGLDIFGFIQKQENCSFKESLKKAAAIAGVSSAPKKKTKAPKDPSQIPDLEPIKDEHRVFLKNRGVRNVDAVVAQFGLKSYYNFIAAPLSPKADTYKFIPISTDHQLGQFYKGKHRKAQCYAAPTEVSPTRILVVAGEKDLWRVYDAFLEKFGHTPGNLAIVTNTSGEGNIPQYFFKPFQNNSIHQVFICYDHDEAGKRGAYKVAELARETLQVELTYLLLFPPHVKRGYDLTDFLNEGRGISDIFTLERILYDPEDNVFTQETRRSLRCA